ncbi:MAG TPA: F0F1 ATP synthase subunit beta, partial [Candidatus Binatia bacterium]
REGRDVLLLVQSRIALDDEVGEQIAATSRQDAGVTTMYFGEETVGAEPEPLARLDSVITFDFGRAKEALYPAVDPINSGSRLLRDGKVAQAHQKIAAAARRQLRRYRDLRPLVDSRGLDLLPNPEDREIVERARRLERFLTQPFHWAEPWTNLPGIHVALEETLAGCRAILAGECDDMPEESFYFVGNLDAAREKAGSLPSG